MFLRFLSEMRKPDESRRRQLLEIMEMFEVLLSDRSLSNLPGEQLKFVLKLVQKGEFLLAFDELTATLAKHGHVPTGQAGQHLQRIAGRIGAKP